MATDDLVSHGDDLEPIVELADDGEVDLNDLGDLMEAGVSELLPAAAPAAAAVADDEGLSADETDGEEEEAAEPWSGRRWRLGNLFMKMGAFGISTVFHIVLLVVLGLYVFEDATKAALRTLVAAPVEDRPEDPPVEVELTEPTEVNPDEAVAVFSSPTAMGATGPASVAPGSVALDPTVVDTTEATTVVVNAPTIGIPDSIGLIEAVPDGEVKGEPRAIVENYQQAFDAITQELLWMLDKGPVLVVWIFDQSESMKDDQKEIRDRVHHVYNQLGIVGTNNSDALLTAVTSYGQGFVVHTQKPTSNREEIVKAIDSVPIDKTGEEMMCQAVGQTIATHRRFATRGRQMALILVTDEAGDRENSDRFLEPAIAEAKAAKSKIYVLGREAVFGYPYAFIRWQHPQTHGIHWLRIDRGPETGFPEQLQTNGFHRRHDAFSSGFGPYEQCRMARETNGVFFMLPSVETNLVGAQKHRYELEALRPFRPDLRSRMEVFADRDRLPLRTLIFKVIQDLNPYNKAAQKVVELQVDFPLTAPEFVKAARTNQQKAILLLRYMAEAEKALAEGKQLREQEADPRWQANYDLIFAQLVAYQARIYEYGAALEDFIRNPKTAAPTNGNLILVHWDIGTRKEVRTEESKPYIERATALFQKVKDDFPGTPWAARAQWELNRGFGVDLHPDYHRPTVQVSNPIPVPKL